MSGNLPQYPCLIAVERAGLRLLDGGSPAFTACPPSERLRRYTEFNGQCVGRPDTS